MAHHAVQYTGDAFADAGAWSPSTSSANFCEEDYVISFYVAEFINSISNFAYVYLALRHAGWRLSRLDQMSTSLLVVGVCSFLFHATLRHGPQFSDDISMLFLAGALLQRLCVGGRQAPAKARTITAAIYACVGTMSAFYVASGNLLVHLAMFVGMLLLIGLRTAYLITREEVSAVDRGKYWRTFGRVCASLALGFVLWNIDLKWCHELRSVRSAIGLPWAWLLELHGWWHVLTAVGGALHMNLARELCT